MAKTARKETLKMLVVQMLMMTRRRNQRSLRRERVRSTLKKRWHRGIFLGILLLPIRPKQCFNLMARVIPLVLVWDIPCFVLLKRIRSSQSFHLHQKLSPRVTLLHITRNYMNKKLIEFGTRKEALWLTMVQILILNKFTKSTYQQITRLIILARRSKIWRTMSKVSKRVKRRYSRSRDKCATSTVYCRERPISLLTLG
ncbi:hypothetical protein LELG_00875 [Lodderomyces elongisporus NRRL YB-4239]|uniref:Uncharacterized protein n=1 Tax=Lodderomyces elongisporus (strain ATCC 11503 / CBS 2605 / JCM 1781 / NBRC 1676 / NRRL YB-4239) TaxID=379508 RepID=A5DU39_LODEL|nr:hypothetical protein LELG_00875 [Lodderomyces elongisporus NRRL YB-4239]